MKKTIITTVLISGIVTAVIVWNLTSFLSPVPDTAELEEQIQDLQTENQLLKEQLAALPEEQGNNRQPRPGWEQYFPDHDTTTIAGKSAEEVGHLLGSPPYKIRSLAANPVFNREIWIFMAGEEDPTALYLFFKGNQLWRSQLDEFNGLYGSGLLDHEEFWLD